MPVIYTLSVCGRLTLDLHDLNNEGTEGNQQMTRMVWVVVKDQSSRQPALYNVNAISGDMFKHVQAEHLHKLAVYGNETNPGQFALSKGARRFDANRINSAEDKTPDGFWGKIDKEFQARVKRELEKKDEELKKISDEKERKKKVADFRKEIIKQPGFSKSNSELIDGMLRECLVTDLEGTLVTAEITGQNRSLARKSCIEFGWVVGLPELTRTDSLFHVKFDPGERGEGSGAGENVGQAIFHRPLNSGVYAVVCHVELYRVGRNDITLEYVVDQPAREHRAQALLESLWYTFVKTSGAQRNTQHPHVLGFEGSIVYSTSLAVPAPTASALDDGYAKQIEEAKEALNKRRPDTIVVEAFNSLAMFGEKMSDIIKDLKVPKVKAS